MRNYLSFSTLFLIIILCFNGCSTIAEAVSPSGGFATGVIDLGGLLIRQVSSFGQIWSTSEGGPDNLGVKFYEPISIPEGFVALGSYVEQNNVKLSGGYVIVAKDATNDTLKPILKPPIGYTLVWSSNIYNGSKNGVGHIWLPVPPKGYNSVGYIVTNTSEKPSPEKVMCVRADYTDVADVDRLVWSSVDGFNVYGSRPRDNAIATGMFVAQHGGSGSSAPILTGLKNLNDESASMPDLEQVKSLFQNYSPVIYFHPNEEYFPSEVDWFFENGALLYMKGNEENPTPIEPGGANLPQGGKSDGTFWLDLPNEGADREKVKRGSLQNSGVYLHIKSVNGGTFTDIVIWVFYPFNGAGKFRLKFLNIGLGRISEHVGDWEHVTLRINNLNGELSSVFFSQHSGGQWVDAKQLEYHSGKKPVVYASLHAHAAYAHPGLVLLRGKSRVKGVGLKDETAKSNFILDTGIKYVVIAAEYLGSEEVVEPQWLNYARGWGPNIGFNLDKEIREIEKYLPAIFKELFTNIIRELLLDVLTKDGPTGPKMRKNWSGDEN